MSKLKMIIANILLLPVLGLGIVLSVPTASVSASCAVSVQGGANCAKSDDQKSNVGVVIKDITNVLLFIIGAVAVIMIILGGIRYTTSNGDASQVTSAKNTILYGVVGVVIALLAFAIVNFVVKAFTAQPGDGDGTTLDSAS